MKVQNIATIEENKNVRPMNKINAVLIELIPCNKLGFANPYINYLSNLMSKKLDLFQTVNSVRANNPSLKFQMFPLSDCKDIGLDKF